MWLVSYCANEEASLSRGLWLVHSCSWLEPRSSNLEFSVSAVSRLWRHFSISYQLPWHADTLLRFSGEDMPVRSRECVKTTHADKCILRNGWKDTIATVPLLGETLCCHMFNLHVFGAVLFALPTWHFCKALAIVNLAVMTTACMDFSGTILFQTRCPRNF